MPLFLDDAGTGTGTGIFAGLSAGPSSTSSEGPGPSFLDYVDRTVGIYQKLTGSSVTSKASTSVGSFITDSLAKVNIKTDVAVKIPNIVYFIGGIVILLLIVIIVKPLRRLKRR
jgi:hypothetical protein